MQEPTPDLPTKDWSNKVIAGVFITLTALTWIIYLTNNRRDDSAAIQFLNQQADSLRGASEEKDKLIVALQRDINRITDTVKIIEKTIHENKVTYLETAAAIGNGNVHLDSLYAADIDSSLLLFKVGYYNKYP